jgi:hypothetical protein
VGQEREGQGPKSDGWWMAGGAAVGQGRAGLTPGAGAATLLRLRGRLMTHYTMTHYIMINVSYRRFTLP